MKITEKKRRALLRVQAANRTVREFENELEAAINARAAARKLLAESVTSPTADDSTRLGLVERARRCGHDYDYARGGLDQAIRAKHEADEALALVVLAEHHLDPFGDPIVAMRATDKLRVIQGGKS